MMLDPSDNGNTHPTAFSNSWSEELSLHETCLHVHNISGPASLLTECQAFTMLSWHDLLIVVQLQR